MNPPHGIFELVPSSTQGLTQAILIACAVLILLALLGAGILWLRQKRSRQAVRPPTDPWSLLQAELAQGLSSPQPADRYQALEASLRKALDLRYQMGFVSMTAAEARRALKRKEFSSDFQTECGEFLRYAEQVLYATPSAEVQDIERWQTKVSSWMHSLAEGRNL